MFCLGLLDDNVRSHTCQISDDATGDRHLLLLEYIQVREVLDSCELPTSFVEFNQRLARLTNANITVVWMAFDFWLENVDVLEFGETLWTDTHAHNLLLLISKRRLYP